MCQNPDENFGITGELNCRYWVVVFARVQMKVLVLQETPFRYRIPVCQSPDKSVVIVGELLV